MRDMTLTGPAAALGLMDKQYAAGRDTVPSSCFAHRLVKEVHLPSGDSPGLEQGKQSRAAPGTVLHHTGKGSRYAHNADS